MENNNIFKISRGLYGNNTVTYNGTELRAIHKLDIGSNMNFNWGDNSTSSEALSYAILNKIGPKELANRYAKQYTKNVISKVQKDDWTLDALTVIEWIKENTNYSIDENAFKNGKSIYQFEERREEDRRKEERRIKREKDFQEEAQRRLKLYEAKQDERRQDDRRVNDRRVSIESDFQEKLQEVHAQYQEYLNNYKKQIVQQNVEIREYQVKLEKYKLFIESLDIESMYAKYCNLNK